MPVIRISDSTFMNLKSVSDWLGTQTPSEAISLLIKEKMDVLDLEPDVGKVDMGESEDAILFAQTPGISHTKILFATVNNEELKNTNWGEILLTVVKIIKDKGLSKEQLCVELQINAEPHNKEDKGYRFYPHLGIAIQGQSAPDAWKEAQRLANKYQIPIEVRFKWRDKNGAQYPGKTGIMRISK